MTISGGGLVGCSAGFADDAVELGPQPLLVVTD
jgi:hypothetical protein